MVAALHIEVVRGNGSNNQFGRLGQSIEVRVSDDAGKPVKGALVIFSSADTGTSVDFGGNVRAAQAQTDETGTAIAPSVRPAGGNGPVEIGVLVEKDGETANQVVHQMNLGFAPETRVADLDVTRIPSPGLAAHDKRTIRISVTDSSGKPVAGAKILLLLPQQKSGHAGALSTESRTDGTAEFSVDAKIVKGMTDVPVRASANGVTATRFIPLE